MIYDITQELFSCRVFPGDPAPAYEVLADMHRGDLYNLTAFSMCAHNGTHLDAPAHFIKDGKTIDELDPAVFLGDCFVVRHEGDVTAEDARRMLARAAAEGAEERLLIAGKATVTLEAARVFAESSLKLIGNESQTVGPENAPMAVHLVLLGAGLVLLEGAVLAHVPEGKYLLSAAPMKLGGREGAPCRALLAEV
jgi:arylformamidase